MRSQIAEPDTMRFSVARLTDSFSGLAEKCKGFDNEKAFSQFLNELAKPLSENF